MPIKIYDSLSEKRVRLREGRKPLELFVCGPTVYDHAHIGHARTYLVFDAFVRYLRHRGRKVFYLQNITDIDDKIIKRAGEKGLEPQKLARLFEKSYLEDIAILGISSVNKYARASEHISEIKAQIKVLIEKGAAYQTKSGVYFEVRKNKDYGKLSKQNLEELRPGYRIEPDSEKKDPLDFSLWKNSSSQPPTKSNGEKLKIIGGEPMWPSPWGWGRPGWHIEDTAITQKYFGPQYDIHGGGADLKFPHHEAEIAQQESASGKKPFVKIWMHTGFLLVYGEKMSKSLGNFVTIKDFIRPHGKVRGPNILKWMLMSSHYRSPFDYTPEAAIQAKNSLSTISEFVEKMEFVEKKSRTALKNNGVAPAIRQLDKKFYSAMDDDFNTPLAIAAVFDFISGLQKLIWSLSKPQARLVRTSLVQKLAILGVAAEGGKVPLRVAVLSRRRETMRANKQFIPADRLRKEISRLGYSVEDTPFGAFIRKET